jgi:hypothetical protein
MTGFQSKRNATRDLNDDCCTYFCTEEENCPVRALTYRYPRTLRQAFPNDPPRTLLQLANELEEPWWPKFQHDCLVLLAAVGWFALACALAGYAWYRSVP